MLHPSPHPLQQHLCLHSLHSSPPQPVLPERGLQHVQPRTPYKCSAHPSTPVQRPLSHRPARPPKPHRQPLQPPAHLHPLSPATPEMYGTPVGLRRSHGFVPHTQPLHAKPGQVAQHQPHLPTHSTTDPAVDPTRHHSPACDTLPTTHLHHPPPPIPAP